MLYSIIPCSEVHDSVEENLSIFDPSSCRVTLQCAWADRYNLVDDLLLNRRPWPWYIAPYVPLATSCSIKNIPSNYTQDGQGIDYLESLVTVEYSSKFSDLFSEEIEPTASMDQYDAKLFTWNNTNNTPLQPNEAPSRLVRGLILSKTYYDILDPLPPELLTYVGCCNSDIYVSTTGLVFEPQTLLYTPPHLQRTVRTDGTRAWQLNVKFQFMPYPGWNTFWNPSDQQYEQIRVKQTKWNGVVQPSQIFEPNPPVPFTGVFW